MNYSGFVQLQSRTKKVIFEMKDKVQAIAKAHLSLKMVRGDCGILFCIMDKAVKLVVLAKTMEHRIKYLKACSFSLTDKER